MPADGGGSAQARSAGASGSGAGPAVARRHRVRHLANWANGSTVLGLLLARLGGATRRGGPWLLYLAEGYRWPFPTGSAFTVGDVVLSRHRFDRLQRRLPGLLAHEEAHARQWAWCLGLPFLPLYLASMAWSWLRTGDRAARSLFERHAGLAAGGYRDLPVRRWPVVLAALVGRRPRGLQSAA